MLDQERSELEAVLASGVLARAPRQAKLLAYVCSEHFAGRGDQLKEYNLATEVLGRPVEFDQARDAIVRVEIYRLRKKLREYYLSAGATHELQIVMQPGQYVPRFVRREESPYRQDQQAESEVAAAQPVPDSVAGATVESTIPVSEKVEKDRFSSVAPAEIDSLAASGPLRHPPEPPARVEPGVARPARFPHQRLALPLSLIAVAGMLGLLAMRLRPGAKRAATAANTPAAPQTGTPGPAAAPADTVRIRSGYFKGNYIDRAGNVWQSDRYYSGGEALAEPRQYIARTLNPAMFQTMRSGQFSYDIPLPPGNYELRLYFCETHYGPDTISGGGETSRLFDVFMNGRPLLHIFDIIKDAGGDNIADVRAFKDVHPAGDGKLHLSFQSLIDAPILNGLEITPAPPGRINPIRIVAQENSYTDHAGNVWQPDEYARGGQFAVHVHREPVSGTLDPDLYVGERFGNFDYAIPVPPGRYAATLYFAETYWGTDNQRPGQALPDYRGSPEGGAGSRVFDVYGNGRVLLKDFDIFKEADGASRAVIRTFHNLEPDGEGKLVFRFVPARDYACVNAIEIVDESP